MSNNIITVCEGDDFIVTYNTLGGYKIRRHGEHNPHFCSREHAAALLLEARFQQSVIDNMTYEEYNSYVTGGCAW